MSAFASPVTVIVIDPVSVQAAGAASVSAPVGGGVPLGQAASRRLAAGMMSSSPVLIGVEVRVVSWRRLKKVQAVPAGLIAVARAPRSIAASPNVPAGKTAPTGAAAPPPPSVFVRSELLTDCSTPLDRV